MAFERCFIDDDIDNLKGNPLFKDHLRRDIEGRDRDPDVFPAVRPNRMGFYHEGGRLFFFDGTRFKTDPKHATAVNNNGRVSNSTATNPQAVHGFMESYECIKNNCSSHSKRERKELSKIHGHFSCAKYDRTDDVVVLDIEICLTQDSRQHTIDLLLFNRKTLMLRFFEAKGYWNPAISAKGKPKVVDQMNRYQDQLNVSDDVRNVMLTNYREHVTIINKLFKHETNPPLPQFIDPVPRLLIVGCDDERKLKLAEKVARLEDDYQLHVYSIGDIKEVESSALFTGGGRWPAAPAK